MKFIYQKTLWDIEHFFEKASLTKTLVSPLVFPEQADILRPGFFLEDNVGNNSFAYTPGKKVWVAPLKYGHSADILSGTNTVIEDEEDGVRVSSVGLKWALFGYSGNTKTPVYLYDNHNSILEALEYLQQYHKSPATLVHIDAHKDDTPCEENISHWSHTKINNFLSYAKKHSLIAPKILSFTSRSEYDQYPFTELPKNARYVLSIDIDIFDPSMTLLSLEEKLCVITHFLPQTVLITLATSPLFIPQEFARNIAKCLWEKM